MASDKLKDVNLESIRLVSAKPRASLTPDQDPAHDKDYDIKTLFGPQRVVVQGDTRLPALFTYHDIGLNSTSCFQGFFNYPEMQAIKKHFCLYHINALGQQDGAPTLPNGLGPVNLPTGPDYVYPTLDQLASMILPVLEHFKIRSFIGFGVGAGANVLSRFALFYPDKVEGLILINGTAEKCGWIEWGYQKWNAWYLKSGQMTAGVEEYLLWHWFGSKTMEENQDLVQVYTDYMRSINSTNLGHFVSSYIARTDLGILREVDPTKKFGVKNFKCSVMLASGNNSAHLDDVVEMNGRLDPTNSTWMKFDCGGMLLEECPEKLSEAMRLFLQGLGYVPSLRKVSEAHPSHTIPSLSSLTHQTHHGHQEHA
jgi:pimeloyl-ACP methyl ester carboxylesterase